MHLAHVLASHFGARHDPLGLSGVLAIIFLVMLVSLPEFFLHHLISRAIRRAWRRVGSEFDRANRPDDRAN